MSIIWILMWQKCLIKSILEKLDANWEMNPV